MQATEPEVAVVNLSRNWGHMGALHAGLQTARGDAIVLMDGDLQDPPMLFGDDCGVERRCAGRDCGEKEPQGSRKALALLFPFSIG